MAVGNVPTPGKTIPFASLIIFSSRETTASKPILLKAPKTLLNFLHYNQ